MKRFLYLLVPSLLTGMQVTAQTYVNFTINQDPLLTADAGSVTSICPGGTANLSGIAGGGNGNYLYSWTPAGNLGTPNNSSTTANPTATTVYTFSIIDGNHCSSSDTVSIIVLNCAGIENENNTLQASVYPNPSEGMFRLTIQSTQGMEDAFIRIYAIDGSMVYEKNLGKISGTYSEILELGNLAKGNYTLMLYMKDKPAYPQKISIQ